MNGLQIFFLLAATTATQPNDALFKLELRRQLIQHEGYMCTVYADSLGYKTVGVGHLIPDQRSIEIGTPISIRTAEMYLYQDIDKAIADARSTLNDKTWNAMSLEQRLAWVDFSFNLGRSKTMKFKKTIAHLNNQEWQAAALQMRRSKWAKQVGRRSITITNMIAGKRV